MIRFLGRNCSSYQTASQSENNSKRVSNFRPPILRFRRQSAVHRWAATLYKPPPFAGQMDVIKGTHMKRRKLATSSRQTVDEDATRVLRALKEATHGCANTNDRIREQLKQCPEAFKVGEVLGKALDSLKYVQEGGDLGDRYFPPSGAVIPPLV